MSYPVYINGKAAGALDEAREGLYRVFSADCEMRAGLHRLWLHGEGRSVYLGLLAPEGGRLRLRRRFSRASGLPETIDCASDSAAQRRKRAEPPAENDLLWYAHSGGALTARRGRVRYLALPAALSPASPAAAHLRRIGGKDYLVFRY